MANQTHQLQKLTDIVIAGETFHLAANGQACLVRPKGGLDPYGNDIPVLVNLDDMFRTDEQINLVQGLLDHLAKYHRDLQTARDRATGAGRSRES